MTVKVNLEFDAEDHDELRAARNVLRYREYAGVLFDIVCEMRERLKYSDDPVKLSLDDFSTWVWDRLKEDGIDPFDE